MALPALRRADAKLHDPQRARGVRRRAASRSPYAGQPRDGRRRSSRAAASAPPGRPTPLGRPRRHRRSTETARRRQASISSSASGSRRPRRAPPIPRRSATSPRSPNLPCRRRLWACSRRSTDCPSPAVYALLAAAYSLVYGLVGRINLAFGALAAAGGYGAALGARLTAGAPPAVDSRRCARLRRVRRGDLGRTPRAAGCFSRSHRATGQIALVATIGLALFLQEFLRLTQGSRLNWVSPVLNAAVRRRARRRFRRHDGARTRCWPRRSRSSPAPR